MYNPKSMNAEDFINHEEILDSLKYADENKNNLEFIDSLLEKARPRKTEKGWHCQGLTHREASVLLACDSEEINARTEAYTGLSPSLFSSQCLARVR